MKYIVILVCLGLIKIQNLFAQDPKLVDLFYSSSQVYELQRNSLGIYRDSKLFSGNDFHPASVANIGIGLIELCIADSMKWIDNAEDQVVTTLESINGKNPAFRPDRNESGYFRHFIDMETGEVRWESEYSTIDTGILVVGALFTKKYFYWNDTISELVDSLWSSIDWSKSIANPNTGAIFREMEKGGKGMVNSLTYPFNEYMIVSYLAKHQEDDPLGPANTLWNNFYLTPENLLKIDYEGISLLTDNQFNYLSHFVIQFAYYLCHGFSSNEEYLVFFDNARKADSLWWANEKLEKPFIWGLGAGSCPGNTGYCVSSIQNNPQKVYSPHIIGGFIPINPDLKLELLNLLEDERSIYSLPNLAEDKILWRKSLINPSWVAKDIQGIDYSSMLFGLASLPEFLGPNFFNTYNNFFSDSSNVVSINNRLNSNSSLEIKIYPNPAIDQVELICKGNYFGQIEYKIIDSKGKTIIANELVKYSIEANYQINLENLPRGQYFIFFKTMKETETIIKKFFHL